MFDSDDIPDGLLVAAIRAGERERFADLVARYRRPLLNAARSRLGRETWAEDAVQETFLCVVKSLDSYDSRFSFRTWLWTILLNQCRRFLAKRRRWPFVGVWADQRDDRESLALALPDRSPGPVDRLMAQERAELLATLLGRLPERIADALRLRFFGELTFPEIADTLGCSQATAKNRVRDGLLRLGALLRERGLSLADFAAVEPPAPGEKP